jgi:hypothetical protein
MSLGQKTRAAQRLVLSSSLSHSNAKFAVPPCALGFGTKDDSLAKEPFVWKIHCPPLGGAVRVLQCSHSYDTAIRRYPPVWNGFTAPGYTAACSLAYTSFRVRAILKSLSFRPTA